MDSVIKPSSKSATERYAQNELINTLLYNAPLIVQESVRNQLLRFFLAQGERRPFFFNRLQGGHCNYLSHEKLLINANVTCPQ